MTDKQINDILKDIVILVDTREKKNEHILKWLTENGIPFKKAKLDSGDYSFILPNYESLGLDKSVLVERKNSWDELIGNFTQHRQRFVNEFERATGKMHIVIENATWTKLFNESYRSTVKANVVLANLMTFQVRYNAPVWLVKLNESPIMIYEIIYRELREKLKGVK
jgi:ERCC4-type nuclease